MPPERLGSMQAQLRVELDELVVAAEALPLAREKENSWRVLAEKLASELTAVRRRYVECLWLRPYCSGKSECFYCMQIFPSFVRFFAFSLFYRRDR